MTVCLIACCGRKLDCPSPARELYRSTLFRKSVVYAERMGWRWAVLSAEHGLVEADDVVSPYDRTLNRMTARERAEWAERTRQGIRSRFPAELYVVLAGRHYRAAVQELPHTVPMAGLGIGQQLAWLTRAVG